MGAACMPPLPRHSRSGCWGGKLPAPHLSRILGFGCSLVDLIDRKEISVVGYAFCNVDAFSGHVARGG